MLDPDFGATITAHSKRYLPVHRPPELPRRWLHALVATRPRITGTQPTQRLPSRSFSIRSLPTSVLPVTCKKEVRLAPSPTKGCLPSLRWTYLMDRERLTERY